MTAELVLFIIFGSIALVAAVAVITSRNPVHAVIYLVINFFALAMFYLILAAQFIAFLQVLVYAGAIMVLFLFVVMLLNLTGEIENVRDKLPGQRWLALLLGAFVLAESAVVITTSAFAGSPGMRTPESLPTAFGTSAPVGERLFFYYLLPFEVTSLLLLIAIIGSIALARRRAD